MSEWKEYKLGEIADIQTGPFGSQLHQSDYKLVGTPIITVEHLGENKIIHENLPLVGDEDKQRLIKYTLLEGDIVFSRVGSVDRRVYIRKEEDGWMFSGRCLRVRSDKQKVNPKFLSYYFGQESFKESIRRIAVGATMPSINTTILYEVDISLPGLEYQTDIASILSSLDDKIDLLYRQNKTLERLAETLFKQWFIKEVDESWEKTLLGELADFQRGISYSGNLLGENGIGMPMHNLNSIDINGSYKYEGIKFYTGEVKERQKLKVGDLLIINTDITQDNRIIGWPIFVPEKFEVSTFTHHLYSTTLLNEKISKLYLYFLLRQRTYRETLASNANGTTVSMLSKEAISNLEVRIPPESKRSQFEEIAQETLDKQTLNQKEIRTLTQLRDTLLPKLMSGEIRLNCDSYD
jgi:type I restriction enzyme S subunit